jgi:hypothetical protein
MALTRMQQRRGTAAQWAIANPILAAGEIGFETDEYRFKIGDGLSNWAALSYFSNADDIAAAIAEVIDMAPETLDTLNELAAAINDDPNFFTNIQNYIDNAVSTAQSNAEDYADALTYALDDLTDVNTYDAADGQALVYDTASGNWIPGELTSSLAQLSDVDADGVADKDTLVYDEGLGLWLPGPGGGRFNVGETPPADPLNGDTWLDSVTGNTYLYYEDYDNPQWIQIGGPGITVTRGASLFIQTTAPSAPVEGDIWYDAAEGFTYLYYVDVDSSQWIQFGLNRNGAPGEVSEEDFLSLESDIIPATDDTYSLGSEYFRWSNIFTADLHLKNNEINPNSIDGTWGNYTIQEGEHDLFLINNRNGKTYKFLIEEVD